jgi:hypothetical protein
MLTAHDVYGVIMCAAGGGVTGYFVRSMWAAWEDRRYHIVYDDRNQPVPIRGRR